MPKGPNKKTSKLSVSDLDTGAITTYDIKDNDTSISSFLNKQQLYKGKSLIIYVPVKISFGTRETHDKIKFTNNNLYTTICGGDCDNYTIGNLIHEQKENLTLIENLIAKYNKMYNKNIFIPNCAEILGFLRVISTRLNPLHVGIKIYNPSPTIKIKGDGNNPEACNKIFKALANGYKFIPDTSEEPVYKNLAIIDVNEPLAIELRPDEFFLLEYILIYVDLAHDIRHGCRQKKNIACHSKSANKVFKEKIATYLEYLHNKLVAEIDYFYEKIASDDEKEYKDSLLLHIGELSKLSDDTSADGSKITFEQRIYSKIIDIINDHNVELALESYKETKRMIDQDVNTKYVSNNACGLEHCIGLPFFDSYTIYSNAKSLPASRYDGTIGTTEGSDITKAFAARRIEDGSSSIKYKIKGNPIYKLSFVTSFGKVGEKTLNKKIKVERVYIKKNGETSVNVLEKADFTIMMLGIDNDSKLTCQKIELDHELMPFFDDPSQETTRRLSNLDANQTKQINIGDIGSIIKMYNIQSNFQAIDTLEKSLCDLFQYINSITKGGGYDGKQQFCNIEGINPLKSLTADDFPSLVLHGDQPAAALNMYLNYVVDIDRVNKGSHIIYKAGDLSPNQVILANCGGILTQAFVNQRRTAEEEDDRHIKKARVGEKVGGERSNNKNKKGGGIECYVDLPDDVMNVLEDFFKLCGEFKMPVEFIPIYNQFYHSYVIGNENKTDKIFLLQIEYIKLIVLNIQEEKYDVDKINEQWRRRVIEIKLISDEVAEEAVEEETDAGIPLDTHQKNKKEETDAGISLDTHQKNKEEETDGSSLVSSTAPPGSIVSSSSESESSSSDSDERRSSGFPPKTITPLAYRSRKHERLKWTDSDSDTLKRSGSGSLINKSTRKRNIKNNKTKRQKPRVNRKNNTTQYRKQKTRKRKYNNNNNKNGK